MRYSNFFRKIAHALSANVLSLVISVLTTLIVPRVLGVEEYGYFQLYLFYASYVGLLHFGWNNGVLLRLGGARYADLSRNSIFSQFLILVSQQALMAITMLLVALSLVDDSKEVFIFAMVAGCLIITGPMYMLLFVLQATTRIEEYSRIVIIQRLFFGILVVLIAVSPLLTFQMFVYAELTSRIVALGLAMYVCRDLIFRKLTNFKWPGQEIVKNLTAGFPLMLSATAGTLIIGIVRFGIAQNWSISVFGKVSLALSLALMLLRTIIAVGHVLFPMLRRVSSDRLAYIYSAGRIILSTVSLSSLFVYFILGPLVDMWLPAYTDSIYYLGILFPIFIYQVRNSVLIEPYLKAMRREKALLWINLSVLALSFITTWLYTQVLHSLNGSLASIVLLVALRALLLEGIVARSLNYSYAQDWYFETFVIGIFYIGIINFAVIWSISLLLIGYIFWLFVNRKKIWSTLTFLRK